MKSVPAPLQSGSQPLVLGEGACTAVGLTAAYAAAAVRAGVSRFCEHDHLLGKDGEPLIVARAPLLADEPVGAERLVRMAVHALRQALEPLASKVIDLAQLPVYIGLPAARPGRPDDLDQALRDALFGELGLQRVELLPYGHAAGLMAFERATNALRSRVSELCLAGGVDSYLDADTLAWLDDNDQIHSSENAYGFIPGEAAGFSLLGSERASTQLGLKARARLWCVHAGRETNLIKTDAVCLGKGLIGAMRAALDATSHKPQRTYCDLNGETYRADEFGFAMQALGHRLEDTDAYVAPADCWGDVGAASGPLFSSLFSASLARGYAPGPWALLTTSSESGERYSAVLSAPSGAKGP